MNHIVLVVVSRYLDLFEGFNQSVNAVEPKVDKLLVCNGNLIPLWRPHKISENTWKSELWWPSWKSVFVEDPFIYAKCVNVGWREAGTADVILCGDDVRFETPFVEELQKAAYSDEKVGVSTIQLWGQSPFVCGYFKRSVINAVGLMDERFTGYGMDDNDWCIRMESMGYYTLPTETVKAKHGGGTSFLRRVQETGKSMEQMCDENNELFAEKWGNIERSRRNPNV